ncbi:glutamate--tRNA ligase [Candidatus Dependentiae bacterium]|nr:glutamate--tRNA ligase [Candidatus Dependentiae bacterium]
MKPSTVRVRFAPSPTGLMHLGSVRIALFNFLFARHYNGTFILRIEDTDLERNFDPGGAIIMEDLGWLGLSYQEGPIVGGPDAPYEQSKRGALYQEKLTELIQKNSVYRCFCTVEELDRKRTRQIASKQPPRYDRTCLKLTQKQLDENLLNNVPFIWRYQIPAGTIQITDLSRGNVSFDLSNFSDFPLTREDGSFTFLFVNCVDDILMKISHVIRGEDHLSNTANQVVLYRAFDKEVPLFWHMPIICNPEGKKLSKRDFGFSLRDLRQAGFLPEAVCNYLAIIGGSFEQEVMTLQELSKAIDFKHIHTASTIKYDLEKLRWMNHQWIMRMDIPTLTDAILPFLIASYPQAANLDRITIEKLVSSISKEIHTLKDASTALHYFFESPLITKEKLLEHISPENLEICLTIIQEKKKLLSKPEDFIKEVKQAAATKNVPTKALFATLRLLIAGSAHGASLHDMITLLGADEITKRLSVKI